jgi:copper chaperone CopZ
MRQSNNQIRASAWGLAAGLVGSLCCIGPSAAVLLGLGSSSALIGWSLDRRLALAGGGALLLAGLALALRQARACAIRPAMRWQAPALMLASFACAYGLLGLLVPELAARLEDAAAAPAAAQVQNASLPEGQAAITAPRRLTLIVDKMTCPPCAAKVRKLLQRQPSVRTFYAESDNDQVTIDYDSSQISAKKLARLIPSSYGVTLLSDDMIP